MDFDYDRAASAFPDISLDGQDDVSFQTPSATPSSFPFDDFGSPPRQTFPDVQVTRNEEIEKFEDQFPELEVGHITPQPLPTQSGSGATHPFAPRPQPPFSSTPILNQQIQEDEPEVIREWREKQVDEIRQRDEASKAKRQETVSKAEASIDQFYGEYASKKERAIRENKDQEADYLENLQSSLTKGTTWERICNIVELQNSQSKTIARTGAGTTDLTRFKDVLLRLRREGDAAPGAAGY